MSLTCWSNRLRCLWKLRVCLFVTCFCFDSSASVFCFSSIFSVCIECTVSCSFFASDRLFSNNLACFIFDSVSIPDGSGWSASVILSVCPASFPFGLSSGVVNMSRALCTVPIGAGSNQLLSTLPAVLLLRIVQVLAASGITLLSWLLLTVHSEDFISWSASVILSASSATIPPGRGIELSNCTPCALAFSRICSLSQICWLCCFIQCSSCIAIVALASDADIWTGTALPPHW